MTKKCALIVSLFALLSWQYCIVVSQACAQDTLLFISTSPLNSTIILDGSPQLHTSPLLIRTLSPGDHEIEIMGLANPGTPCTFTLAKGEIRTLHFDYISNSIRINDVSSPTFGTELQLLPEEYPKQRSINILNIAVPVFAVISGLLTINDSVYDKDTGLFFSPVTITAYTATAGLAAYRIALGRQRKRYNQSIKEQFETLNTPHQKARDQYNLGQESLAEDELDQALLHYTTIIDTYENTLYFPYALYKIAKIHAIEEEYDLAVRGFEHIIARYPLADLYDRSLKSLADLYASQGLYVKSIGYLDRMVYADPLFNRTTIYRYRLKLEEQWINNGMRGEEEPR